MSNFIYDCPPPWTDWEFGFYNKKKSKASLPKSRLICVIRFKWLYKKCGCIPCFL